MSARNQSAVASFDDVWRVAVKSIGRTALGDFIKSQRASGEKTEQKRKAEGIRLKAEFLAMRLLGDPRLIAFSEEAILSSTGPTPDNFLVTFWPNLCSSWAAHEHTASWKELAEIHEEACTLIVPKHEGHVYSPVRNISGHRCNQDTTKIYVCVLDADDVGASDKILKWLRKSGLAYIIHESATHRDEQPKFRVLIPLVGPYKAGTEESRERWKGHYNCLRLLFGSIAGLSGHGFDPACEAIAQPYFFGTRPNKETPPRKVHWSTGRAIDLDALAKKLPYVPTSVRKASTNGKTQASYLEFTASAEPSLLELVFQELGWLGAPLSNGYGRMVRCPNNELHENPIPQGYPPTSSTVLVYATTSANLGAIDCKHATCGGGYMAAADVLALCPQDVVARCRQLHGTVTAAEIAVRRLLERPVVDKISAKQNHAELLQILRGRFA
jgi:hypothetical protein